MSMRYRGIKFPKSTGHIVNTPHPTAPWVFVYEMRIAPPDKPPPPPMPLEPHRLPLGDYLRQQAPASELALIRRLRGRQ